MCRLEFGVHPQHATCSLVFTPNVSPFCLHLCCLGFTPNVLHDMSLFVQSLVFSSFVQSLVSSLFVQSLVSSPFVQSLVFTPNVLPVCAEFGVHPQHALLKMHVLG